MSNKCHFLIMRSVAATLLAANAAEASVQKKEIDSTEIIVFNQPVDQCGKRLVLNDARLVNQEIDVDLEVQSVDAKSSLTGEACGCPTNPSHRISVFLTRKQRSLASSQALITHIPLSLREETNAAMINKKLRLPVIKAQEQFFYEIDFDCSS